VNTSLKVKNLEIRFFKVSQIFVHNSVVIMKGQTTIAMYLHKYLEYIICTQFYNLALNFYQNDSRCKRTFEALVTRINFFKW
jgi:hypothetical protein